jgi:drug/metabolite transporter superfamily protein YnfA
MTVIRSLVLFVIAALAEIGGGHGRVSSPPCI